MILSGCAGLAGPADTLAQMAPVETAPWFPADEATGQVRDVEGLEKLGKAYPDSSSVRLRLLNAYLAAGNLPTVLETLRWLHDRAYVFSETARVQIPVLVGEEFAEEARALLLGQAEAISASEVFAIVPAEAGLVESALVDVDGGNLVVSSVSGRNLWRKSGEADWQAFQLPGAGNLSGIVYDPVRALIWVASGRIDGGEAQSGDFAGLIGIRYPGDTPRFIPAPQGANFSDLHRASDGTIYASDPLKGGIYALRSGENRIATIVPPGQLRSPQGLASDDKNRLLYVSDYRYGLAVIDLETGQIGRVTTALPLMLDGIDGLWRNGDDLIAVQNGTSPMRILALRVGSNRTSITQARVLEQAHPDWTEPLSGYLGNGALYYVGNGQWDRWVAGEPAQGRPSLPTEIRRLPLD